MKKKLVSFFLTISFLSVFGVETNLQLSILFIPDSLKKDALAVVRENNIVFEYETFQKGTYSEKEVITVLKEQGKKYADFNYPGDKYRTLTDFSGKIYDAMGNLVGKIKKSDVHSSEWSQYLGSDNVHYYYSCEPPSYPFTIVYEYTISFKNGILSFPGFFPQSGSDISAQNADYKLIIPLNTKITYKEFNIAPTQNSVIKNSEIYSWNVKNLKAIEYEPFMPDFSTFLPLVYARPISFIYDDVNGEITDWNSMGKWENTLLNNRQILTDATISKVKELTSNATSDREKVKILYDYLGKTTHYQNISLGIGGLQPMPAAEVCKIGFGDCKGLSNYLRAMLKVIGIKSNFAVIKLDENSKNFYEDYVGFNQFNHAILQVPLENETLWLECTNPEVPFGYVHNGIAGHQALVITENGGDLVRLPDYTDTLNVDKNVAEIILFADGKAQAKTTNTFSVKKYDDYSYFTKLKNSEQLDKVRKYIRIPSANVTNFTYIEDKSSLPNLSIIFDWNTTLYGNKTGTRLFVPVNPLRKFDVKLKKGKRKFNIEIIDGDVDKDYITLQIPENFEIESLPATIDYKCDFGSFKSTISVSGQIITVYQEFKSFHGNWEKEKYQELLDLFDKVSTGYSGKIILKSK